MKVNDETVLFLVLTSWVAIIVLNLMEFTCISWWVLLAPLWFAPVGLAIFLCVVGAVLWLIATVVGIIWLLDRI